MTERLKNVVKYPRPVESTFVRERPASGGWSAFAFVAKPHKQNAELPFNASRSRQRENLLSERSELSKLGEGSCKRVAFTLAELLITLAVIGVVAAMTLPTLIQKHQKMTWVSQLKSNYSLFSQGFKKMMADEGVERIDDTSVWQSMGGSDCWYNNNPKTSNQCKDFFPNLKKYFKITSIEPLTDYTYKYLNDSTARTDFTGSSYAIHLSNGAMIWAYIFYKSPDMRTTAQCQAIKAAGGYMCGYAGSFKIDVNGKKGPNIYGRDIFFFRITERGVVVPNRGIEYLTWEKNGNKSQIESTKMQPDGSSSDNLYACKTGNSSIPGWACGARIIEIDNWQMKY